MIKEIEHKKISFWNVSLYKQNQTKAEHYLRELFIE